MKVKTMESRMSVGLFVGQRGRGCLEGQCGDSIRDAHMPGHFTVTKAGTGGGTEGISGVGP